MLTHDTHKKQNIIPIERDLIRLFIPVTFGIVLAKHLGDLNISILSNARADITRDHSWPATTACTMPSMAQTSRPEYHALRLAAQAGLTRGLAML